MSITNLLFSFRGRIGRLEYFLTVLALGFVYYALQTALQFSPLSGKALPNPLLIFPLLVQAYVQWAVSVKRAHDLNHSGWWVFGWTVASLIAGGLCVVGVFFQIANAGSWASSGGPAGLGFSIVGFLIALASFYQLVIKMLFFRGSDGENNFGPPDTPSDSGEDRASSPSLQERFSSMKGMGTPKTDTFIFQADPAPVSVGSAAVGWPEPQRPTGRPTGFGKRSPPRF